MTTGRTLTGVSTLTNFNIPYKKTIGHKFRDLIATCGHYLKPVKKYIFPNFITVHYVYIIFMTILCSILIYPCHNADYIDILFISCGAVTQGGLNTIDINSLRLYQQIIIYIICCLCTPIAIHGCLAFVRLYWFERYFDDIKNTSKRNFKMRRTRTILHREMTKRRTLTTRTQSHQRSAQSTTMSGSTHGLPIDKSDTVDTNFQEKLFSGLKVNRDEQSLASSQSSHSTWGSSNLASNISEEQSHINSSTKFNSNANSNSTSNSNSHIASTDKTSNSSFDNSTHSSHDNDNILKTNKRATLPLPGERFAKRRKSEDVKPEDMYRSIMMLRERQQQEKQHNQLEGSSEDEEPVLFIKGRNITTSSIKVPMKKIGRDTDSYRDNIRSPEFSDSDVAIDMHNYPSSADDDDDDDDDDDAVEATFADNSNVLTDAIESISDYNVEIDPLNEYTDIEYTDNDSEISPGNTNALNANDTAVSGISSESVSSGHSDSNSQNSSRNPSQHITFANNLAADRIQFGNNGNKDVSFNNENREGQSIQFNITAPPRKAAKRRYNTTYHSKPVRPNYGKRKASSSRSILKHLKKGKKFQKNIQRRLSNSNVIKSATEVMPFENKQATKQAIDNDAENHDAEEYFADNETDEDIPYDVSPAKLNELSKTPQFQKMVYKNWKANHGRGKKKDKDQKRRSGWMFDNEYGGSPIISTSKSHQHASRISDHNDQASKPSSIGSISTNMTSASDNSSDYYMGTRHDYDEENQDIDPAYFGLDFDFNASNTMHLPLSRTMSTNYLSWQPTIGRNSTFVGLTKSQRDELGGVEYRAIKLLCRILVVYYIGFHIMAFTMLLPWICKMNHYIHVVRSGGVSPAWWGFFTAMSAFNDLGLTLTPDSMNSFSEARYPLVVMMWFIIIGNTGFPIFLRVIIWVMFHLAPDLSQTKESLGFLLDHPRRCFTLLFPSSATWWLLLTLLFLNITDLILFVILDLGSKVLQPFARSIRVLIGAFQAVSTRTAGFSVVDLSQLHSAIQVSYMLMMYVSVLPLAISIRRTNVYEEQSLGLYGKMNQEDLSNEENDLEEASDSSSESDTESEDNSRTRKKINKNKRRNNNNSNNSSSESVASRNPDKISAKSFVGAHLRKQLSFDLWFLFLGLFIICICENGKIKDDTMPDFNIFSILFEIVSAYGTVGLSLGYPNTSQSFSGQFTVISKLIIIAMLIRGRCRGLPYSLDRAILLPSERLEHIDHIEDLKLRRNHAETTNNEDPMTDYVKNTTGWIRNKFERFGIPATGGNKRSESDPILQEYEMEESPNHQNSSNSINDNHNKVYTL